MQNFETEASLIYKQSYEKAIKHFASLKFSDGDYGGKEDGKQSEVASGKKGEFPNHDFLEGLYYTDEDSFEAKDLELKTNESCEEIRLSPRMEDFSEEEKEKKENRISLANLIGEEISMSEAGNRSDSYFSTPVKASKKIVKTETPDYFKSSESNRVKNYKGTLEEFEIKEKKAIKNSRAKKEILENNSDKTNQLSKTQRKNLSKGGRKGLTNIENRKNSRKSLKELKSEADNGKKKTKNAPKAKKNKTEDYSDRLERTFKKREIQLSPNIGLKAFKEKLFSSKQSLNFDSSKNYFYEDFDKILKPGSNSEKKLKAEKTSKTKSNFRSSVKNQNKKRTVESEKNKNNDTKKLSESEDGFGNHENITDAELSAEKEVEIAPNAAKSNVSLSKTNKNSTKNAVKSQKSFRNILKKKKTQKTGNKNKKAKKNPKVSKNTPKKTALSKKKTSNNNKETRQRPKRNRVAPLRFWEGEKIVWGKGSSGRPEPKGFVLKQSINLTINMPRKEDEKEREKDKKRLKNNKNTVKSTFTSHKSAVTKKSEEESIYVNLSESSDKIYNEISEAETVIAEAIEDPNQQEKDVLHGKYKDETAEKQEKKFVTSPKIAKKGPETNTNRKKKARNVEKSTAAKKRALPKRKKRRAVTFDYYQKLKRAKKSQKKGTKDQKIAKKPKIISKKQLFNKKLKKPTDEKNLKNSKKVKNDRSKGRLEKTPSVKNAPKNGNKSKKTPKTKDSSNKKEIKGEKERHSAVLENSEKEPIAEDYFVGDNSFPDNDFADSENSHNQPEDEFAPLKSNEVLSEVIPDTPKSSKNSQKLPKKSVKKKQINVPKVEKVAEKGKKVPETRRKTNKPKRRTRSVTCGYRMKQKGSTRDDTVKDMGGNLEEIGNSRAKKGDLGEKKAGTAKKGGKGGVKESLRERLRHKHEGKQSKNDPKYLEPQKILKDFEESESFQGVTEALLSGEEISEDSGDPNSPGHNREPSSHFGLDAEDLNKTSGSENSPGSDNNPLGGSFYQFPKSTLYIKSANGELFTQSVQLVISNSAVPLQTLKNVRNKKSVVYQKKLLDTKTLGFASRIGLGVLVIPPGSFKETEKVTTDKVFYVSSASERAAILTLKETKYRLSAGDSFAVPRENKFSVENFGTETVELVVVDCLH